MHVENMEQLNAYNCHQNVTEPQATEYHKKGTHVYTNCGSGLSSIASHIQAGPANVAGRDDMDR